LAENAKRKVFYFQITPQKATFLQSILIQESRATAGRTARHRYKIQ